MAAAACAPAVPAADDGGDVDACAREAGAVDTFELGFASAEGVAVTPAGDVFVVADDGLWRVDLAAGDAEQVADVWAGVGAVWWAGAVWAAAWEDADGEPAPGLVRYDPATGAAVTVATPDIAKPNFLLPTRAGDALLVSDDFDTRIFRVTADGTTTVWAADVPSPNGMGWIDGALAVASTFVEPALWRIEEAPDGTAGARSLLADFTGVNVPDGLLVAADDTVLVALNAGGTLTAVPAADLPAAQPSAVATDLLGLASLAWLPGPDGVAGSTCEVVATQLFGGRVWRIAVGLGPG